MKQAEYQEASLLKKKCLIYRLWTVVDGWCCRKNYFDHSVTGKTSFIDFTSIGEFQTLAPRANLIKMKTHFQFILMKALLHRKLLATTYLRDKQEKYPGYASRNGFLKINCLMCGGRTEWHYYNWRSDSSHFCGRIPVVRIEILKLHQVQIN